MLKELFRANEFMVIAFASTHHALEAESLLQDKLEFIIIPTPREISASCGLSLKIYPRDLSVAQELLDDSKVTDYSIYQVVNDQQKKTVTKV